LNTVCQIAAHNSSNFDDEDAINYVKNLLSVDRYDAKRTLASIKALVALKSPESIRSHIPEKFPKDMADKVANTIASSAKRESAIESGYMPQLKDFTWRVDVKVASDAASRISVPTCLLQLNVRINQDSLPHTHSLTHDGNFYQRQFRFQIRDPPTEVGK